jgi:hypothetical protein
MKSPHSIFIENVICLSKRTGWIIENKFNPKPNDLYIVFGGHIIASSLLNALDSCGNRIHYVIMNTEQEQSLCLNNKYYLELMKKNHVLNFTNDRFLENFGIFHLTVFDFEFVNFNLNIERIYDISFIGSYSKYRDETINNLKEKYPEKIFYVDFEWKNCESKDITKILSQSKCVLNIPFYENSSLETHRINKALSCGCDVVSFTKPHDDYTNYVHFINHLEYTPKEKKDFMNDLNQKHLSDLIFTIHNIFIKLKCNNK